MILLAAHLALAGSGDRPSHTRIELDAGTSAGLLYVAGGGPELAAARVDVAGGVHGALVLGPIFLLSFDAFGGNGEAPAVLWAGAGLALGSPLRDEANFRFVHNVVLVGGDGTASGLVPILSAEHGGDVHVELDFPVGGGFVVGGKAGWGRAFGLDGALWAGPSVAFRHDRRFHVIEPRCDLLVGRVFDGAGAFGVALGVTVRQRLGEFDVRRVGPTLPRLEDER